MKHILDSVDETPICGEENFDSKECIEQSMMFEGTLHWDGCVKCEHEYDERAEANWYKRYCND